MQTQQNTATTTQRTQAQRIIAAQDAAQDAVQDAPQLQQMRAGILRLRMRVEGQDNDLARLRRCVTTAAEVLGWEHPALGPIEDEITRLDAAREKLLADLDELKAALRVREQALAAS